MDRQVLYHRSHEEVTHLGFSDESLWNQMRYRSLAVVSLPIGCVAQVEQEVSQLLQSLNIRELAWKDIASAKGRIAGIRILDAVISRSYTRDLRVDVLIWDTHDSRHRVKLRDDTGNLSRMYYHLLDVVTQRRWGAQTKWCIHVDERSDFDWDKLHDTLLGRTRSARQGRQTGFFGLPSSRILQMAPVSSSEQPLVQVADLFAGLTAFSWNMAWEHRDWRAKRLGARPLFPDFESRVISNRATYRHEVLQHLFDKRLDSTEMEPQKGRGLVTFRSRNSINFWLYEPQHPEDKAPQRVTRI